MKYFLLSIFAILANFTFGASFSVDGLYYNTLIGKRVEICAPPYDAPRYGATFQDGIISVPSEITYEGAIYSVVQVGPRCFYGDTDLHSVDLPSTIQIISENAFGCCYFLESFSFPESLTSIGDYAFWLCASCDFSELPSTLESVGDYAFSQSSFDKLTIPDNVVSIGKQSFEGIPAKYIHIGKSLSSIGYAAFLHNLDVETISVSSDNQYFTSIDDVLYDKKIEKALFAATNKAGCLVIPQSVLSTDYAAFQNTKYSSIQLPDSLISLGYESCSWMNNLQAIIIPSGYIDQTEFSYCENLKTIVFGREVHSIKKWCTTGCNNLENIYSLNSTPPVCPSDAFDEAQFLWSTLYVPSLALEYYKAHETWGKFKNIRTCDDYSYYLESLSFECPASLKVGDEYKIEYSLSPSNALFKNLLWETSDNEVAAISNGKIVGIKSGTVTISANSLDGSNLSCSKSINIVDDSGIDAISSNTLDITVDKGFITIHNGCGFCTISSLSGVTIFSDVISDSDFSIKCKCGIYIVKIGTNVSKVIVK